MRLWQRVYGVAIPAGAVISALLIGAVFISLLGANPVEAYGELFVGAFGSTDALADTAVRAMPLLLVGTGICVAFRARMINIGGEGQMLAGALAGTLTALAVPDLPSFVLIPLVMLAGFVGGGLWGSIPGALKAYLGVNEILTTIMLNIVAGDIVTYLLTDPLKNPDTAISETERLSRNADLPILVDGTRLHLGVVIAVLAAVFAWVILWRTTLGYRIRAVGRGPDAARYAGISVARMQTVSMAFSGAMCGLAGAVLVFGSTSHRFSMESGVSGFTQSAGFNGIVAGLFGGLHPLWTIPSSFLFGGLIIGANAMQRAVQINSALVIGLNGLIVVFVVSSTRIRERLRDRFEVAAERARGLAGSEGA